MIIKIFIQFQFPTQIPIQDQIPTQIPTQIPIQDQIPTQIPTQIQYPSLAHVPQLGQLRQHTPVYFPEVASLAVQIFTPGDIERFGD